MRKRVALILALALVTVFAAGCPDPPVEAAEEPIPVVVEPAYPPAEPQEPEPVMPVEVTKPQEPVEPPAPPAQEEPQEPAPTELVFTVDELISFYFKSDMGGPEEQSRKLDGHIITLTGVLQSVEWRMVKLAHLDEFTATKYGWGTGERFWHRVIFTEEKIPGVEPFVRNRESIMALKEQIGEVVTFTGKYHFAGEVDVPVTP